MGLERHSQPCPLSENSEKQQRAHTAEAEREQSTHFPSSLCPPAPKQIRLSTHDFLPSTPPQSETEMVVPAVSKEGEAALENREDPGTHSAPTTLL